MNKGIDNNESRSLIIEKLNKLSFSDILVIATYSENAEDQMCELMYNKDRDDLMKEDHVLKTITAIDKRWIMHELKYLAIEALNNKIEELIECKIS